MCQHRVDDLRDLEHGADNFFDAVSKKSEFGGKTMDWKGALRSALTEYAELHGAGRVLDCHYVKVDDTKTSYNGSQYMFFIPTGTTPPKCGIPATMIFSCRNLCVDRAVITILI